MMSRLDSGLVKSTPPASHEEIIAGSHFTFLLRHLFLLRVIVFFYLFLLSSCSQENNTAYAPTFGVAPPAAKGTGYLFGVHPLHNPGRLLEVYGPLMDYLNAHLDGVSFSLEASRNYADYEKKLFAGRFQFALPNPYQTVMALKHGYRVFGKMGDDQNFRGIILVRRDSSIKEVADLKGKAVSFPAPTALAGTMMPQYYLYAHGIDVNREIQILYVGSQESSIMNAYLGKSAAAATWPPPWMVFSREHPEIARELKIQWQTESLVNNGLVVRQDVPESLTARVAKLLFALHATAEGRAILARMSLSRFEAADEQTYMPVRQFLHKFSVDVRPVEY